MSRALDDVGTIDAGGGHLDKDLVFTGPGAFAAAKLKHLGAAVFVNAKGFHARVPRHAG